MSYVGVFYEDVGAGSEGASEFDVDWALGAVFEESSSFLSVSHTLSSLTDSSFSIYFLKDGNVVAVEG